MDDPQTQMDLARTGQTIDEALNTFLLAEHAVIRDQAKTPVVKEGEEQGYLVDFLLCIHDE